MTPRTEAGRRLLKWEREGNVPWDVAAEAIIDIEREARVSEAELAAAIADHGDICSRMAIPECAPAIFAALSGAAQEQGK